MKKSLFSTDIYIFFKTSLRCNQRRQPQSDRWLAGQKAVEWPEALHVLRDLLHLRAECGESLPGWWEGGALKTKKSGVVFRQETWWWLRVKGWSLSWTGICYCVVWRCIPSAWFSGNLSAEKTTRGFKIFVIYLLCYCCGPNSWQSDKDLMNSQPDKHKVLLSMQQNRGFLLKFSPFPCSLRSTSSCF